jgi:uncharacterized membrane protein
MFLGGFMSGRKIAITGLMVAVTAVMSFVPFFGTIVLPIVSITIAFLPTIVTAMTAGFYSALLVGASAGVFSLIRAFYTPTLLSPFLQNPLVSVLPRMMIAVVVFLVFRALIKTKLPKMVSVAVAAAAGSITNTAGVLGTIWLFRGSRIYSFAVEAIEQNHPSLWALLIGIVSTNGLFEVIGNSILATFVVMALRRAKLTDF